jgi:hypothetical protein
MNPIESCLIEVATAQAGYFTTRQARDCGNAASTAEKLDRVAEDETRLQASSALG